MERSSTEKLINKDALPGVSMSLLDLLRQEYVSGKVLDKYTLDNGNLGLVLEDRYSYNRYHVEFRDGYKGPSIDNLFGFLKEPFGGKTEYVNRLIAKGDIIDLTLSYSKGPLRQAYRIHSVSNPGAYKKPGTVVAYRAAKARRY